MFRRDCLMFSTFSGNNTLSLSLFATKDNRPFCGTFTNFSVFNSLVFILQIYISFTEYHIIFCAYFIIIM
jgi:hypothetical protein